mmetsp:Transcript_36789/g.67910  ORF Transcript_36789/g.67910 Transcript_36789/m.67910 type:complete len:465 (-) Transcript_36789:165-1559(-)
MASESPSPGSLAVSPNSKRRLGRKDFEFTDLLGEGSYAKVYLAIRKNDKKQYAAKIVDKSHVIKHKKIEAVMQEKKVLTSCDHPSIVHLHFAFQDKYSFYFMLELVPNGELFDLIQRLGKLPNPVARFYAAEIINVLEYLHSKGIIHRDLKPENLLLTKERHLKLTDFGTAGILKKNEIDGVDISNEADSCVGTAEYVSPEVLDGKKQSPACDLWSLGCIVYHMLVGKPPFRGASEYLTFQKVMECKPPYPEDIDSVAKDLISKLLVLEPSKRLGAENLEQLKSHEFFKDIDWKKLTFSPVPKWREPVPSNLLMSQTNFPLSPNAAAESGTLTPISEGKSGTEKLDKPAETSKDKWTQFLIHNEKPVFTGLIQKRSFSGVGLFAKKRQLILTSFPRILYVDPQQMKLRGEIPWSENIVAELKNRKNFVLHTKGKQYNICCLSHEADAWVSAIRKLKTDVAKRQS